MGAAPDPRAAQILKSLRPTSRDLKIGVDGGVAVWRKARLLPDFAVGDFDSLEGGARAAEPLMQIQLPAKKERSDLYYAAQAALHLGATELVCVGVTGGRADHHLAAVFDLSELDAPVSALDSSAEYYFRSAPNGPWRKRLKRGQLLSIFAARPALGVTLSGLKYTLQNARLAASSRGLSNTATGGFVTVRLTRGRLVIIVPHVVLPR